MTTDNAHTIAKLEKAKAIAASVMATASAITGIARKLPKTNKANRNIFIKTYNRRPGNKITRKMLYAQIALTLYMSRAQIQAVISQPIPKYPRGSYPGDGDRVAVMDQAKQKQ